MGGFVCPVCGELLKNGEREYKCNNGHSYDKAKSGYVNLLPNNLPSGKNHGDNKMMIKARKDFLEKGYYEPLLECIEEELLKVTKAGDTVLDAGCGECWYTDNIYNYLESNNQRCNIYAVDISKDALSLGAKRNKSVFCAVASIFHLPVADKSCDAVLSVFAPFCEEEFKRVIKRNGYLVMVIPSGKHLWSLKSLVYDKPYENEVRPYEIDGFEFVGKRICEEVIFIDNKNDVENLFKMTPYYYKTSEKDQKKINNVSNLETQIAFEILIYRLK